MKSIVKRSIKKRILTLISKIEQLQRIESNSTDDLNLPFNLENMKQSFFNWYCDNNDD